MVNDKESSLHKELVDEFEVEDRRIREMALHLAKKLRAASRAGDQEAEIRAQRQWTKFYVENRRSGHKKMMCDAYYGELRRPNTPEELASYSQTVTEVTSWDEITDED
jgi:hypothetical protein